MRILSLALVLWGFIVVSSAWASKITIDLDPSSTDKMPASDLVYQGKPIDEVDALALLQSGIDLSTLNPVENHLWQNKKLTVSNQHELAYPDAQTQFVLKQIKASPSEIFRAVIHPQDDFKKQFVLVASLDNHTNILRATLLRLLGYDVDVPKFYKKLNLKFKDKEQKAQFLELVGEQTLTKRDRWVSENKDDTTLILKGFTLEPAELKNVNIHLPLMTRQRQQDRRLFRALLDLYVLTDFTQEVNKIQWQVGRIFNNKLIFNHPYASEFNNTTLSDLKWLHQKINQLTRQEIAKALSLAQYPQDIEALLLEKLLSRINKVSEYLGLNSTFSVNTKITLGNVQDGKLRRGGYSEYVINFFEEDELSPYRFKELFKLFRTQITYASLSGLLESAIQKFVPDLSVNDAMTEIRQQMTDFRQNNSSSQGVMPVRAFTRPLANGRMFANRNIVFGQYLGSSAPIQLVDSVGADVNLGAYTALSTPSTTIIPNLTANISVGRSYTHVRAMPDLTSASKQKISKIFVPALMKKLGRVIKDEFECSLSKFPFVEEDELNNRKIYYIKYDQNLIDGRKLALAKRQELIEAGIPASIILIVPIDREFLCLNEIATNRKKNISDFLNEFAENETFIINDSVRLSARVNAPLPVPNIPGANLNLGSDHNVALMRSIMFRKVNESMEITVQQQRDLKNGISQGLNYFIEILNNSNQWTKGKLYAKVFRVKLNDLTEKEEEVALQTLRSLFVNNNRYELEENYKASELDHDVKTSLHTFRLLWFKAQKMRMDHTVSLVVPNQAGQNFLQKERTRNLFSTAIFRRKGNDFHTFLDRTVSSLLGFISLGSTDQDPGQSFMGNSSRRYYMTESELTDNYPLSPTTRVEYAWTGWKKKTRKLEKYFKEIESFFSSYTDHQLIDRSLFHGSDFLRSYDIKTTLLLYPSAFEFIKESLFESTEASAINILYFLYGADNWSDYCQRAIDFFGENGPQVFYGEKTYNCIPLGARQLIELRNKLPKDKIKLTKKINEIYQTLFEDFDKAKVLQWLGKKNFFSSTRIVGFRENHPDGYLEYISNTVGEYNTQIGTGLFDSLGGFLGLSSFQLRALNYTPGM